MTYQYILMICLRTFSSNQSHGPANVGPGGFARSPQVHLAISAGTFVYGNFFCTRFALTLTPLVRLLFRSLCPVSMTTVDCGPPCFSTASRSSKNSRRANSKLDVTFEFSLKRCEPGAHYLNIVRFPSPCSSVTIRTRQRRPLSLLHSPRPNGFDFSPPT